MVGQRDIEKMKSGNIIPENQSVSNPVCALQLFVRTWRNKLQMKKQVSQRVGAGAMCRSADWAEEMKRKQDVGGTGQSRLQRVHCLRKGPWTEQMQRLHCLREGSWTQRMQRLLYLRKALWTQWMQRLHCQEKGPGHSRCRGSTV